MAKVWVLDTETKGTGAEMVPLDKVLERKRRAPPSQRERASRPRRRAAHDSGDRDDRGEADRPRGPRRYRVVSALTGSMIADDVGLVAAVEHVQRGRSLADMRVYVWAPEAGEWRALSLEEQRLLRAARNP